MSNVSDGEDCPSGEGGGLEEGPLVERIGGESPESSFPRRKSSNKCNRRNEKKVRQNL